MPWSAKDASKHKKGLNESEAKKWAKIANEVLKKCKENGGSTKECEAKAIRIANSKFSDEGDSSMHKKEFKKSIPTKAMVFEEHADVDLSQYNDSGVISMTAYSGKIIKNHFFWGDLAIDVSGIKFSSRRHPILEQHDLMRKIGFSNSKPDISENKLVFDNIKLLSNEVAQEFYKNAKEGFPYQASIRVKPLHIEELGEGVSAEVNGYTMRGPGTIFRSSECKEASVCVFGYDHRTNVTAFSDSDMEEVTFSLDSSGEAGSEEMEQTEARTPEYEGKESKDWDKIDKSLQSYVEGYYKFNPNAQQSDKQNQRVDELADDVKRWIAARTLLGDAKASTVEGLISYPVTNPKTNRLNKNALVSAKSFAEREESFSTSTKNSIDEVVDKLLEKEFAVKKGKDNKNSYNDGGKCMDLKELKEQYPELTAKLTEEAQAEIQTKLQSKEQEAANLQAEVDKLKGEKADNENRIAKLEKAETLRQEEKLQEQADRLMDSLLSQSKVDSRLHSKVKALFSYRNYVDENNKLKTDELKQAFSNEIKDWETSLKELGKSSDPVLLGQSGVDDGHEEDDSEKDANFMLGLLEKKKKKTDTAAQ